MSINICVYMCKKWKEVQTDTTENTIFGKCWIIRFFFLVYEHGKWWNQKVTGRYPLLLSKKVYSGAQSYDTS